MIRHVSNGGAGGAYAPPVFGRSVNPISTRGSHYPHPVLLAPPDFQTLRHAWIAFLRAYQETISKYLPIVYHDMIER